MCECEYARVCVCLCNGPTHEETLILDSSTSLEDEEGLIVSPELQQIYLNSELVKIFKKSLILKVLLYDPTVTTSDINTIFTMVLILQNVHYHTSKGLKVAFKKQNKS